MKTHIRLLTLATTASAFLCACGGNGDEASSASAPLSCDDSMKAAFKPDANTTVTLVKAFKKGDPLQLTGTATASTSTAANDVCMVKLNVGPGNPGPVGAPSTSAGIGIEVWLPAESAWNKRVHNVGGGGYVGGPGASSLTAIGSEEAAAIAGNEGAVSSFTDTGHSTGSNVSGAFLMNPDGTINTTLWADFASRGIHEQAVKTKALATAFYGTAPKYSYWEGRSTGGRQGLSLAQNNPADYDGIIANYPAINWTRFETAELWPQIVFQRDLGGVSLTAAQQDLVSNAAISACDLVGGQHYGYILDAASCKYDPTKDPTVLCTSSGGTNATSSCVSAVQAKAINKIWYGMTADGSVPDPAVDNGWAAARSSVILGSGLHRWYGLPRGTSLYYEAGASFGVNGLAGITGPFEIADDQVALNLQNSKIAEPTFVNATGNGESLWRNLSYADLNNAYDQGVVLQPSFGNINTDNPDLSAFKARGGKLLQWHGTNDELIMVQGTVNYYNTVVAKMGSLAEVQSFYKLYLVPGVGHGTPNGTANPSAKVLNFGPNQFYDMLTAWVENGSAPDTAILSDTTTGKSRPACVYPKQVAYVSGDIGAAASYTCQ